MSKLPVVSGSECIKALEKIDFAIVRQRGSHIVLVRENPKNTVIVPNHINNAKC
jgi:predicted RNA binding protein YcfA (HicA-like mRNA interferase family)